MNTDEPLPDTRPFTLAAAFLRAQKLAEVGMVTTGRGLDVFNDVKPKRLWHWREEFFQFAGYVYRRRENEELTSELVKFLNRQTHFAGKDNHVSPLRVTNAVVNNTMGQLRALCQAPVEFMPTWLDGEGNPDPARVIAFTNGLLDIDEWLADESTPVQPPTENWFSVTALPRPYDPEAKCPAILAFLVEALEDQDQIDLFQEWAGLMLVRDTSFQKMMWFHGVGGGGKGTCARLLTELVGRENSASFGLFDLTDRFTLSSFVGKTLAISHDAHLGQTTDSHKVIEHILAISGEDDRLIDRKNREILQGIKLATRLVIAANGFPHLPDAGIALRRRSLVLSFTKTFEGKADPKLFDKLAREMPGFTLWAMRGLRRLLKRNKFTETDRGREMLDRLGRLSSPVRSFVEDCCEIAPAGVAKGQRPQVLKRHLYSVWKWWQQAHGHRPVSFNTFSERLYETFPTIKAKRAGKGINGQILRSHVYEGLKLTLEASRHIASDDQRTSHEEEHALSYEDGSGSDIYDPDTSGSELP